MDKENMVPNKNVGYPNRKIPHKSLERPRKPLGIPLIYKRKKKECTIEDSNRENGETQVPDTETLTEEQQCSEEERIVAAMMDLAGDSSVAKRGETGIQN